jgi:hypothetical protein
MTESQLSMSYQYLARRLASSPSSSRHNLSAAGLPPNSQIWAKLVPPSRHQSDDHINEHCPTGLSNVGAAETMSCPNFTTIQRAATASPSSSMHASSAALQAKYLAIQASALPPPVSSPTSHATFAAPSAASYLYPSALAQATHVTSPFVIPQIGDAVHHTAAATHETLPETYIINPATPHAPFPGSLHGTSRSSYGEDYHEKNRKLNDLMDHLAASKARARELEAVEQCEDYPRQADLESEAASSSTGSQIFFPISENSLKTDHFPTEGKI